ncbi:MAG: GTPase Era [Hydrogenophilales bacterium 28-61-23]|nr:MAG: GTPase Era [Hydrogenophilales bacterium 28-61-23]
MSLKINDPANNASFKTGVIAVVGRPNVGKSTLVNALVGAKVSIVSSKPQTTRHRILGVRTEADAQYIFADTPGFQTQYKSALNSAMNRTVTQALAEVDVVLWLVEARKFTAADQRILPLLPRDKPVVLVVNKIDLVEEKNKLLPFLESMAQQFKFAEIVPLSAEKEKDALRLPAILKPYLPEGEAWFGEDDITDRSSRFLAAEIVREKVFRLTGDEIPYVVAVTVEQFEEDGAMFRIGVVIWVDRDGHKPIVLGRGGEHIKRIASEARVDMEKLFDRKVFLQVWVKVKGGWADDSRLIKQFGYE